MRVKKPETPPEPNVPALYATLLADIKQRVQRAQVRAMLAVNAELIRLYVTETIDSVEELKRERTERMRRQKARRQAGGGQAVGVGEVLEPGLDGFPVAGADGDRQYGCSGHAVVRRGLWGSRRR